MSHQQERFDNWQTPEIEHGKLTKYNWVVYRPDGLKLGKWTDIGAFTAIFAHHGVEIGDEVQIGGGSIIYSISTISVDGKDVTGKVTIGKGSQIGAQSTIMPGVTIGEGVIVGAHSLVIKNIPDNELWFGVPARFVRKLR